MTSWCQWMYLTCNNWEHWCYCSLLFYCFVRFYDNTHSRYKRNFNKSFHGPSRPLPQLLWMNRFGRRHSAMWIENFPVNYSIMVILQFSDSHTYKNSCYKNALQAKRTTTQQFALMHKVERSHVWYVHKVAC